MWWIIAITSLVILIQAFLLGYSDKSVHPVKKAIITLLSFVLWLFTFIIATTNSLFITEIINDYYKGTIIKIETITIQGVDTTKIVKYKYKQHENN